MADSEKDKRRKDSVMTAFIMIIVFLVAFPLMRTYYSSGEGLDSNKYIVDAAIVGFLSAIVIWGMSKDLEKTWWWYIILILVLGGFIFLKTKHLLPAFKSN